MTTDGHSAQTDPQRYGDTVGAILREARESVGLNIGDVARGLRIRLVYVQGIENDDYSSLPGKTYVLGFLRSYAEFLGLDGDDIVARYRRQLNDKSLPAPSLSFPIREPEARLPRGAILLLSIVLAAGAVYGGALYLNDDAVDTVDRVAPVPDRLLAESRPAVTPGFAPRNDPSSAFAAVTPQPSEAGASASVLSQPSPALLPPSGPVASAPVAATPVATPPPSAPLAAVEPAPLGGSTAAAESVSAPTDSPASAPAVTASDPVPAVASAPVSADSAGSAPAQALVQPPPLKPTAAARQEQARSEPTRPTPEQQTQALNQASQPQSMARQVAALPPPRDIVVVARVDSWIEVRDANNSPLVSLLLRVGDSYRVPEGANYRLVTGDVRGLEVRVDGVAIRQHGADDNKPHRTLSLDGELLRSGSAVID